MKFWIPYGLVLRSNKKPTKEKSTAGLYFLHFDVNEYAKEINKDSDFSSKTIILQLWIHKTIQIRLSCSEQIGAAPGLIYSNKRVERRKMSTVYIGNLNIDATCKYTGDETISWCRRDVMIPWFGVI